MVETFAFHLNMHKRPALDGRPPRGKYFPLPKCLDREKERRKEEAVLSIQSHIDLTIQVRHA